MEIVTVVLISVGGAALCLLAHQLASSQGRSSSIIRVPNQHLRGQTEEKTSRGGAR